MSDVVTFIPPHHRKVWREPDAPLPQWAFIPFEEAVAVRFAARELEAEDEAT